MSIRERSLRRASNSDAALLASFADDRFAGHLRRMDPPRSHATQAPPRSHATQAPPRSHATQAPPRSHATQAPPRSHATQAPPRSHATQAPPRSHATQAPPRSHATQAPPRSHATQAPDPAFERGSLTLLELSLESGEIVFDFGVAPIIFERRELRCRCGVPPFHFVGQLLHLFHRGNAAF
jgi:hypothetical protein